MTDLPIIDRLSGLDHMLGMGDTVGQLDYAPGYLDDAAKRRVNAYVRLMALERSVRRHFIADEDLQDEWREFGDPAVYTKRVAAAVIGSGAAVVVDGADQSVKDRPDIPEAPQQVPADVEMHPVERQIEDQIFEVRLQQWQVEALAELERWSADVEDRPGIESRQDYLEKWAEKERLVARIKQLERRFVVPLGDGVIEVLWDEEHLRPTMELHSPAAYEPVLDDSVPGEYPRKVHLHWIYEEVDEEGEVVEYVRRITYELVPVEGDDAEPELAGSRPPYLGEGDQWLWSCVYSNGSWLAEDFDDLYADPPPPGVIWTKVTDPGGGEEPVDANRVPLGIDFIPVVQVPNTDNDDDHFGDPLLAIVAQLLDEIAATDRDDSLASRRAADPPFVVSGLEPGTDSISLGPGSGVKAGDGGGLDFLDVASGAEKVAARVQALLRRLSVNLGVPEGLVGRVDASDVPSGIAFTLSFTAFEQLVEDLRLVREQKYRLLLKMVQRMAIVHGDETLENPDKVYPAGIRFGSFMPQDLMGAAQIVQILVEAKMISQETGIAWLNSLGLPSEDRSTELESIRHSLMSEDGKRIAEALGPEAAARFMNFEGWAEADPDDDGDDNGPTESVADDEDDDDDLEAGDTDGE